MKNKKAGKAVMLIRLCQVAGTGFEPMTFGL